MTPTSDKRFSHCNVIDMNHINTVAPSPPFEATPP